MLIIRSQDRETLVVDDVIYNIVHFKSKGVYEICISNLTSLENMTLAFYSTKEKALKVLDSLEAFCCCNGNQEFFKNTNTGTMCSIKDSFKFPQDEEVE